MVNVESEWHWSYLSPENRLQQYKQDLTWSESEDLCVSKGSHLVSVGSQRENEQIKKFMSGRFQALVGRRKADKVGWEWTDGRAWDYQNWERGAPSESSERGNDCVQMKADDWYRMFLCSRSFQYQGGS